ncbi:DNA-binding transcriptional LysR family regulator [Streptococcus loxodontisalivarius]|uniref:DNA-binding transcriptional LysR family regulator n=1 Tax=Streptococcus loxodontisalivarius TaxID=1349415 RepID=A0ABS2PUB2_9STRE|nr:DNA-binding transcriptional LysR family regulator [Streptococcus loxodontisalivarius]
MEKEIGLQLFIRSKPKIKLSQDGIFFKPFAQNVVDSQNEMFTAISNRLQTNIKEITIGTNVLNLSFYGLLTRIRQLEDKYPNLQVNLIEKNLDSLESDFRNGKIDFLFVYEENPLSLPENIRRDSLLEDQLCLAVSKKHPLSEKKLVTWKDLDGQKGVTFEKNTPFYHKISRAIKEHGVSLNLTSLQSDSNILSFVSQNQRISFFLWKPASQFLDSNQLAFIPFDEPEIFHFSLYSTKEVQKNTLLSECYHLLKKPIQ